MYLESCEICHLCCYFSWIFNSISPYSEPYSDCVFLLWSHINYDAWVYYCASHWYIFVWDKTNSVRHFFTFPINMSASHPNSFDNLFCQSYLVYFYFYLIRFFTIGFTLCLYQSLSWQGTRVRLHIQSVWPCCVLLLELLVPCDLLISYDLYIIVLP